MPATTQITPLLAALRRRTMSQAHAALRPAHVLLAEDNYELRVLVATALARRGYQVTEVSDSRGLLEELGRGLATPGVEPLMPDVVVSDVRIPGRSGLEVLAGLREGDWSTPFIFITAFGDRATHAEAARLGAAIYDKPFDLDELCGAVARSVVRA